VIAVFGLGNPGEKYKNTRHNLGFLVLDALLEKQEPLSKTYWEEDKKLKSLIKKIKIGEKDVLLVKPLTFMNNSGLAVRLVRDYFKIEEKELFVVSDDIDLPFGKIKVRFGGASAGHKGVQSIIDSLGTDKFWRIRLGIGRPKRGDIKEKNYKSIENYVLSNFGRGEAGKVKSLIKEGIGTIFSLIKNPPAV
jgi:PTH1 family peptidyl-tRNA hydrolase